VTLPTTGTTTFAYGSATAIIGIPIFGNGVYNNPSLTFSVQLTGVTNVVGPPVTLAAHSDFTTGTTPESVAVADLNGDGKPDLVVANDGSNSVSVLLNTTAAGAATPTFATHVDFATGTTPGSGLADGIVVTPSHNPPDEGGFKYNPPNGGPADTDVTGWIQDEANRLLEGKGSDGVAGIGRVPD